MTTMDVARRLVELIDAGDSKKAIEELYADTVDVQEASDPANLPPEMRGAMQPNGPQTREQLLAANEWFYTANEIHDGTIEGPWPLGNRFIVVMGLEMTPKEGPMAGQRMSIKEAAEYTVEDGKIVASHFFYDAPC